MVDPLDSPLLPDGLRAALKVSPDNAPLLFHAADCLLAGKEFAAAETIYKRALALDPALAGAQLGLATAFFQQGKHGAALVLVESLALRAEATPDLRLLHARLAAHAGEMDVARDQYRLAIKLNRALRDPDFESSLGLAPTPASPPLPPPPAETATFFEDQPEAQRLPAGEIPPLGPAAEPEPEHSTLRFADVGGMEKIKEEIRLKIILPLKQPDLFRAYGKKAGGGILLYGPPGCGKTFLARATAGEVDAGFIAVGISDVLDMWIGQSEKNLHAVFEQARAHRPCVLFFDEVDALGANRTDMLKSAGRQIINQFLAELDGVAASNEGVLILAATNAPWHLDSAFRRPGRFDRILFVPPPDEPARRAILQLQLQGKPHEGLDFAALAAKSEGFSGADLKAVVDLAVEDRLRAALQSGRIEPLGQKDLLQALKAHRPTARDWFETARNYALYANQSGLYDEIRAYLKLTP